MAERQESLTVYRYRYWDEDKAAHVSSGREATLECIRCGLGTPILDSGRRVRVSELDVFGRVVPPVPYPSDQTGTGSGEGEID